MATLVSPGVSVTITDESFFIPVSSPTVPLFFIATADEKLQADPADPFATDPGTGSTPAPTYSLAEGTAEHNVVRTVTSLKQSIELYGTPRFIRDEGTLDEFHGDCRNEYGLFALNQYLGIGNRAYVIRANVNLNDDLDDLRDLWDSKMTEAKIILENLINEFINSFNSANGFIPGTYKLKAAQTEANYDGLAPNGSFVGGDGTNGTLTVGQDETNFDGVGSNGTFGPGAGYVAGEIITMTNGATVQVDTEVAGAVATFTILTAGTSVAAGSVVSQSSTTGIGAGFDLTPGTANLVSTAYAPADTITLSNGAVITVGTVDGNGDVVTFSVTSVGGFVSPGVAITQDTTSGTGEGFTLTPDATAGVTNVNLDTFKTTVTGPELISLTADATDFIFDPTIGSFSFISSSSDFLDDQSAAPFPIYANGYLQPATDDYFGHAHYANNIASFPGYPGGGTVADQFTALEGGDLLVAAADDFKYTQEFLNNTSLGANDAARRVSITTALQASVTSNTDIRSDTYDYNLILCPGYPEVVDEMLALVTDIADEAMVIADTPVDRSPDGITNPGTGWAVSTERRNSVHVAYYYPWSLATNLDGRNVVAAPSGTALRTIAYSDDVSFLWFAPAGTRRGLVTGVSDVGYVSGTLGGPTTFVPAPINQGQQDAMYQDTPSGRINPIKFQPGIGLVVWGQKTSAPQPSAMDRINVSRLMKYVKRQLRRNTLSYVFEPNDQLTRDNLKATVDNFLGDLIVKRGLYDFATVCDESNNTADRIDRNEMYIDVAVKPVKAAEFLYIPIRIVSTDTEI